MVRWLLIMVCCVRWSFCWLLAAVRVKALRELPDNMVVVVVVGL